MMPEKEDKELVERAQKNPEDFAFLYTKYVKKVYEYFWYRLGHQKEIAEDFMQDTFVKAFRALSDFTYKGFSYFTYLTAIAHNLLVNHYRSQKTVPLEEAQDIPVDSITPLEQKIDSALIWKAVQKLNPAEQEVITLMYQKQLSVKEIAAQTNRSENAIKLIASRARKKLSKDMRLREPLRG